MAYIGGGAQPTTDWEAHEEIWKLRRDLEQLQVLVAELRAAMTPRDEADELIGERA